MDIKIDNRRDDVEVIVKKQSDGTVKVSILPKNARNLASYKKGDTVKLGEREYIILEQSGDTTAVIAKKIPKRMRFGSTADWDTSDARVYCNGEFFDELADAVGKNNIIEHTVNLMCDDGSNKGVSVKDRISILTTAQYRKYRELLPACGESFFTATKVTALDKNYARSVCYVNSDGVLDWNDCGYHNGVRPFCILNSSILVPQNGSGEA